MLTCIILVVLGAIALFFYLLEKCKRYSLKGVLIKTVVSLLFIAVALAGAIQNQNHILNNFIIAGLIMGLLVTSFWISNMSIQMMTRFIHTMALLSLRLDIFCL